jgi:hypothetical protein
MTVCIAALSRPQNVIVAVSDLMLSDEVSSHEGDAMKFNPIGPANRWLAMFAGDPTVRQKVVNERMGSFIDKQSGKDATSRDVADAFEAAFADALREKAERLVLNRYGIDTAQFLREGRAMFGRREFASLHRRLRAVELETDFLVAGWEKDGLFRMFTVHDPGTTIYHDPLGFCAIGTGAPQADGYLCGAYYRDLSAPELVYRLCEAKFRAESAPTVGRRTVVWLLYRDPQPPTGKRHFLFPVEKVGDLRTIFEQTRWAFPQNAVEIAATSITGAHPVPW